MSNEPVSERLHGLLTELAAARCVKQEPRNRHPRLPALKEWQAERLALSFSSLRVSPRYGPAAEFFLSDLYATGDLSWRDRDLRRVLPTMLRWLPERALHSLAGALELDLISHRFDLEMATRLRAPSITTPEYARAYRDTIDIAQRERQIELIVEVGRELERLVRIPLILGVLKLARGPARGAGFAQLQGFLERGFAAFRHMGPASEFLSTIADGERQVMARLLEAHPDPFGFPVAPKAPLIARAI